MLVEAISGIKLQNYILISQLTLYLNNSDYDLNSTALDATASRVAIL